MNDRSHLCVIIVLGVISIGALAVCALFAYQGRDPPPGIAAIAGMAVGALAGIAPTAKV